MRPPILLLAALSLSACEGKSVPLAPADAAPSAPAPPPAASSAQTPAGSLAPPPSAPPSGAVAGPAQPSDAGLDASVPLDGDGAITRIFALPEVKAFAAAVERTTGDAAHLSAHVEGTPKPGCAGGTPGCRFAIYVGEHHPDHMARWQTFHVDAMTAAIWVADISGRPAVTYEEWKQHIRVVFRDFPEFRRFPVLFPIHHPGRGALGYGTPEEVVTNIGAWKHPAKAAFAAEGMTITRVELYEDKTYPVFFVTRAGEGLWALADRDPAAALALARRILAANAGWPYEIAASGTSPPERSRFRDAPSSGLSRLRADHWSDEETSGTP